MATRISATRAARSFSDVLSRVRYRGEEFIVEKGGEPIGRIVPIRAGSRSTGAELARVLSPLPRVDAGFERDIKRVVRRQGKVPKSRWGR